MNGWPTFLDRKHDLEKPANQFTAPFITYRVIPREAKNLSLLGKTLGSPVHLDNDWTVILMTFSSQEK